MRHRACAGVIALAALACGTEPIELASSYTVRTVEGTPPPRLVAATVECDVSLGGGHLSFTATDQFELGLDVLTDCSRAGGATSEATFGYTGTAQVDGRHVTFHSANGSGPVVFEGQGTSGSRLQVVVPGLVPLVDQVTVEFAPE
jgi:hypothetical protein